MQHKTQCDNMRPLMVSDNMFTSSCYKFVTSGQTVWDMTIQGCSIVDIKFKENVITIYKQWINN